jgi:hypothetical protein
MTRNAGCLCKLKYIAMNENYVGNSTLSHWFHNAVGSPLIDLNTEMTPLRKRSHTISF